MDNMLVIAVVILGVLVVAQVMRVFELASKLTGAKEWEVTPSETRNQAMGLVIWLIGYFAFFIWLMQAYGDKMLTISGSEHGEATDTLLWFNFAIIIVVFVITHIVLIWFAWRYRGVPGRRADFVTHNNRLELIWTSVPAFVLAIIITYGITTWNNIQVNYLAEGEEPLRIELYQVRHFHISLS